MEGERRVVHLRRGLAFAFAPAVLFLPGVAFFSVCPPSSGSMGARVAMILFLASDIWAVRELVLSFNTRNDGKIDRLNLWAWAGCTIAILTLLVSAALLSDYPWSA
jgi:hypothetical protein